MYKTIPEAKMFMEAFTPMLQGIEGPFYLAVPFTLIHTVQTLAPNNLIVGAQNMHEAVEGSFTGEIAGKMIKDAGARFVILGHYERRRYFGETDITIHKKVLRGQQEGLEIFLCIGESEEERSRVHEVLEQQLTILLEGVTMNKLFIAYEPFWAVGTGKTPSPEEIETIASHIKKFLQEKWHQELPVLYGGSVNVDNVSSFIKQPSVDGVLVGGISLTPETFISIIKKTLEI